MNAYIVRVFVPLDVRVENAPSVEVAKDIAYDYVEQDPVSGVHVLDTIRDALDNTAFYVGTKPDVRSAKRA